MTAMPTHCTDCQRPLRHPSTPAKGDGAVAYAGHAMCVTCRKRTLREANTPTHCDSCEHPLRSKRATETDHPGTVIHVARGLCRVCYDAERHFSRTGYTEITPAQHAYNLMIHHTFITERRKRGVPVDGYQADDTPDTLAQITARPKKTPAQRLALARLLEQLEHERAGVAAATRIQEARHRNEYGTAA